MITGVCKVERVYSNLSIGCTYSAHLPKCRNLPVGIHYAKQKTCGDQVKGIIGECQTGNVHFGQAHRFTQRKAARPGLLEHLRTYINTGYVSIFGIESDVSTGADADIKYAVAAVGKHFRSYFTIAEMLERKIQYAVKAGDQPIAPFVFCAPYTFPPFILLIHPLKVFHLAAY